VSNIITRVKAAQGLKFPTNQEVTMNADGSGGPVSINKQVGPPPQISMTTPINMAKKVYDNYDKFSDAGHLVLDGLGMVPVFGAAADLVNAAWYGGEALAGREDAAAYGGMSLLSAIPGFGQYATAGKYAMKGFKGASKPIKNYVKKNKIMTGLDVVAGSHNVIDKTAGVLEKDYNKPKVQEEVSALESERKGDEAINDPMSSGKTKSWSKGYSDYKAGGGKGSLSDFKNESNSWWNSAAGQKYAKDKNIKHRIASPSKQRYMGGVASSNRQGLKYYKQ